MKRKLTFLFILLAVALSFSFVFPKNSYAAIAIRSTVAQEAETHYPAPPNSGTQLVITSPATMVTGDVLVAGFQVGVTACATLTPPSGWTLIGRYSQTGVCPTTNAGTTAAYYHVVTGADVPGTTTYTFTWSSSVDAYGLIWDFTGVNTTTPINVVNGEIDAVTCSKTYNAPSITTTVANTFVIALFGAETETNAGSSFSPTNGLSNLSCGSRDNVCVAYGADLHPTYKTFVGPGATGAFTGTRDDGSLGGCAHTSLVLALQPMPTTCSSAACGTTNNGNTCTSYSATNPACGTLCSSISRLSTCTNGSWDQTPLAYGPSNGGCTGSCCASGGCAQTNQAGTCTTYASSAPACGVACSSTVSTCQAALTWSPSPQANSSCTACCNNPWGSGTTNGNSSATAYNASSAYSPDTCASHSESRTCSASTGLFSPVFDGGYSLQACTNVTTCAWPAFGNNATISTSCSIGATSGISVGVDKGAGTQNIGWITISGLGTCLTIGAGNNQTLYFGQINLNSGTCIIIAKGVGAKLIKSPLWVPDADNDGYPDIANPTATVSATQPVGYVRANVDASNLTTADCAPADPSKTHNITGYTDADGDGYGTGSGNQVCSGSFLPSGYASNNTDCDDTAGHIYQNLGCTAPGAPTTKSYSAAQQTYVVPTGASSVTIEAYGGIGGATTYGAGGNGGYAKGTYTVTPGETLYVYTGGAASGTTAGYNGGGTYGNGYSSYDGAAGGGATDVRQGGTALANRIIVAGGGGGAGSRYTTSYGVPGAGGAGGPATGATGGNGSYTTYSTRTGSGGGGGTPTAGGAAGVCGYSSTYNGAVGTSGTGGAGKTCTSTYYTGSGGGGGGYWGGGSGGCGYYEGAGGGGGGSNYVGAGTNTVSTAGVNNTNGYVIFTPLITTTTCSNASCAGPCAGWLSNGYCWYAAGGGVGCTSVCSTHGGVAGGNCDWTGDSTNCATCKHYYPTASCYGYMTAPPYWNSGNNSCTYDGANGADCDWNSHGGGTSYYNFCACVN